MEKLVQTAKILSDKNRVKILGIILRENELCVCEICDTLKLSQPLVSRHLKQMREADIVETSQSGKWVIYKLKPNNTVTCFLEEIQESIEKLPKIISCQKI